MTAPTPPTTPSTSMERNGPSGRVEPIHSPSLSTPISIQSMGYWPKEKVVWNITKSSRKKMGNPQYLCDRILSMRWVVR